MNEGHVEQKSRRRAFFERSIRGLAFGGAPFLFWAAVRGRPPVATGKVKLISAAFELAFEKFLIQRNLNRVRMRKLRQEYARPEEAFICEDSRAQRAPLTTRKGTFCAPLNLHNAAIFFV